MVTWESAAKALVEGAISKVGGAAFESLIGGKDLATMMKELLQDIDVLIKKRIAENELRKLDAELKATQSEFLSFVAVPAGIDRIENATTRITNVTYQLESFGLNASSSYMVAVSLWLAILSEREEAFGVSEFKNSRRVAKEGTSHARQLIRDWRSWHRARYYVRTTQLSLPPGSDGKPRYKTAWIVLRDGVKAPSEHPRYMLKKDAQKELVRLRKSDWDNTLYPTVIRPMVSVMKDWHEFTTKVSPFRSNPIGFVAPKTSFS